MTSNPTADLELMRATLLLDSDPAAAARRATAVLALVPGHAQGGLLLAAACRRLGDPAQALAVLEPLAADQPASAVVQLELARAYAASDRASDALAAYRRVVALDPGFADAWRALAAGLFALGDTAGGDAAYAEYSRLASDPPELADVRVAIQEGRLAAADGLLIRYLERHPNEEVGLRAVAEVATRLDSPGEAELWLRKSLAAAPGYAGARYDLARCLYTQQRVPEALEELERLLRTEPEHVGYRSLKSQLLRLVGRTDESVALMEAIVAERPADATRWLLLGQVWRELGQQDKAVAAFRQALTVRPGYGEAYLAIADLKAVRFTSADIATMREHHARSALLSPQRSHLEFALGKALEDAGEYEESLQHYAQGNALRRAKVVHDPDVTSAVVQRSKEFYTPELFAARSGWGSDRDDPIFIVGLPRSGSTLLEQILATHSAVEGTRELPHLPAIAHQLTVRTMVGESFTYPAGIETLARPELEAMAVSYLELAQVNRPLGKARFVDKMLGNHLHVGLIHLLFPRAAIIDARRHPLGCGFSCFRQFFGRSVTFTYDLGEFGRYYRDYADLMDHMDGVLPGRVHRAHYEHVVASPEAEVRRLLEYCGLPFEQACLRFYDNRRVVHTISSEQVRRPIYVDSVDQWRHYEPWLGALKAELGDLIERYPAA